MLYRRPRSPNWWVRFQLDWREIRLSTGTADRAQAEEFETQARNRAWRQARLGERPVVLWATASKAWLKGTQKRSKGKDAIIIAWFDQHLHGYGLDAITPEVLEELRQLKAEETSQSTSNRYMALMRSILNKELGNAAPKVPMFSLEDVEVRWLRRQEFERLCKHLPDHLVLAARLAAYTGLRMRAMLGLTWDRVDLVRRSAVVPGLSMKGKRSLGVPLSKEAVGVLKQLQKMNPDGRVFQWRGKPIDDCNTKAFQDAVQAAGITPFRWHDLRHTFAAWAVQNGVSLYELMQIGGWRTYASVLRYAHLAPQHLLKAVEKVAKARR